MDEIACPTRCSPSLDAPTTKPLQVTSARIDTISHITSEKATTRPVCQACQLSLSNDADFPAGTSGMSGEDCNLDEGNKRRKKNKGNREPSFLHAFLACTSQRSNPARPSSSGEQQSGRICDRREGCRRSLTWTTGQDRWRSPPPPDSARGVSGSGPFVPGVEPARGPPGIVGDITVREKGRKKVGGKK